MHDLNEFEKPAFVKRRYWSLVVSVRRLEHGTAFRWLIANDALQIVQPDIITSVE